MTRSLDEIREQFLEGFTELTRPLLAYADCLEALKDVHEAAEVGPFSSEWSSLLDAMSPVREQIRQSKQDLMTAQSMPELYQRVSEAFQLMAYASRKLVGVS